MSFEQLGIFLSKSSKNKLEIGGKFSGKSLTAMRNHLLKINETLVAFARGMQHERTADSLGSLTADLVEMEKFIAVGNVSQAVESKERPFGAFTIYKRKACENSVSRDCSERPDSTVGDHDVSIESRCPVLTCQKTVI
jgi:hypothetical protein